MASIEERQDRLQDFSPVYLLTHVDELNSCTYDLIFYPAQGLFKILSSKEEGVLPPIVISYNEFTNKSSSKLNSKNMIDSLIELMRDLWGKTSSEDKMEFFDNVPLNSLYIGSQYS